MTPPRRETPETAAVQELADRLDEWLRREAGGRRQVALAALALVAGKVAGGLTGDDKGREAALDAMYELAKHAMRRLQ